MDYTGTVLVQLDMEELKKTIHELMEEGAESIAICFLHSYANDENEKKALERNSAAKTPPAGPDNNVFTLF